MVTEMTGVSYASALEKGLITHGAVPRHDELKAILSEKPIELYGLRFPEKDAKSDRDYMRISFKEEDE